jgi:hypothetical protein
MAGVSAGLSEGGENTSKFLHGVVGALARHPRVGKAIAWMVNSISAGFADWPSGAIGPVFAMPTRDDLTSADFRGTCLAIFVDASLAYRSGGLYVLFMGEDESLASLIAWVYGAALVPMGGPAAFAASIVSNSRAVAVFGTNSLGLNLSVGASANMWAGRIG